MIGVSNALYDHIHISFVYDISATRRLFLSLSLAIFWRYMHLLLEFRRIPLPDRLVQFFSGELWYIVS